MIELEHICERHGGQLQTALACDENSTLHLARLFASLEGSYCGPSGVSNASEDGLVVYHTSFWNAGRRRTESCGSR